MPCYGHGSLVLVCSLPRILDLGKDGHPDDDLRRFERIADRVIFSRCDIQLGTCFEEDKFG